MSQKLKAAITSVGGYVPETKLTNFDLEKLVDTNDEWIRSRTGISERRILREPGKANRRTDGGAAESAEPGPYRDGPQVPFSKKIW